MYCRDISGDDFDMIAGELVDVKRANGDFETVTGIHKHHGVTILIRDNTRCWAVVDDAKAIDVMRSGGFSSEGWLR